MNIKTIGAVVVLLLVAIAGSWYWNSYKEENPTLITEKEVQISPETREATENRVAARMQDLEKVSPDNKVERFNLYMQLAQDQLVLGHLGKARAAYDAALAIDGNATSVLFGYSKVLAEMGDLKKALEYSEKTLEKDSINIDYWRWRVELEQAYLKSKPDKVQAVYERAIEKTKTDPNMLTVYAQFLEQQGKIGEARNQWQNLTQLFPENAVFQDEVKRLDGMLNK